MLACSKLTKEEKRSCGEMYTQYRWFMYSVALQYASHEMSAEDIVQNASCTMAMYSKRIWDMDEPARLTYLRFIVQSAATNHFRRTRRDERLRSRLEILDGWAQSAEDDYMDFADNELLSQVMDSLDERDRILLTGKFYLRLSDEELAEIVGCKPNSVRMLVKRAKATAQKKLIKEGFKHDEI